MSSRRLPDQQKAANPRGRRLVVDFDADRLLLRLVDAVSGVRLRGLDLQPVLFGGGRQKAPDAMGLPIRGLLNFGQAGTLGPPDQFQYLRGLALGARRAGFLRWG